MANYLVELKKTGVFGEHSSVDGMNQNVAVPVGDEIISKWKELSQMALKDRQSHGEQLVWVLVDGFLLYWDEVNYLKLRQGIALNYVLVAHCLDARREGIYSYSGRGCKS